MEYSAVIFDLDGTLLDTLADIADAANRVLLSRQLPTHEVATYRHFVGNGVEALMQRALPLGTETPQTSPHLVLNSVVSIAKSGTSRLFPFRGFTNCWDCSASASVSCRWRSCPTSPIRTPSNVSNSSLTTRLLHLYTVNAMMFPANPIRYRRWQFRVRLTSHPPSAYSSAIPMSTCKPRLALE